MTSTKTYYSPQDYEWGRLLDRAEAAATNAIRAELLRKDDSKFEFDCGFAWVIIPANNGFARWCKKQRVETKEVRFGNSGYPTGWQFWCPGQYSGQSVRIWRAGAEAFAEVLQMAGLVATSCSRLD